MHTMDRFYQETMQLLLNARVIFTHNGLPWISFIAFSHFAGPVWSSSGILSQGFILFAGRIQIKFDKNFWGASLDAIKIY